jgi:hypothetical protein
LRIDDFTIDFTGFEKIIVFSFSDDFSLVEHDDLIGVLDSTDSLGDDEHR